MNTPQKLPALKRILAEGADIYFVYGVRGDGSYEVARNVVNNRFVRVPDLHPQQKDLVPLTAEEFRRYQETWPETFLIDCPLVREADLRFVA